MQSTEVQSQKRDVRGLERLQLITPSTSETAFSVDPICSKMAENACLNLIWLYKRPSFLPLTWQGQDARGLALRFGQAAVFTAAVL